MHLLLQARRIQNGRITHSANTYFIWSKWFDKEREAGHSTLFLDPVPLQLENLLKTTARRRKGATKHEYNQNCNIEKVGGEQRVAVRRFRGVGRGE